MKHFLYIILISILLSKHYGLTHVIRKRQLFREQVLPHAGGKIPDSAFHTDRLALNQLQREGIAVPDGVLLEQRRHQVHPHPARSARPTFLVAQSSDRRYTSPTGAFSHNDVGAVESTYSIPMPWEQNQYQKHTANYYHSLPMAVPVFKELRLPHHSVFNFDYSHSKSKLQQPSLVKRPVPVQPTVSVVPVYGTPVPSFRFLEPPKPSLSLIPQNFVSYHAALGNLLSYQPAYAYGNDWNQGWGQPPAAFHHDLLSNPLSSFEDFYGDPGSKQRYYRNVNHQEGSSRAAKDKVHPAPNRLPQQIARGRKPLLPLLAPTVATSSLSATRTTT
ncbi:uncharacterized protein LOC129731093 [Wyeomyia smithii]|uniref:uncharacterized protein LOC129731093 n=1 Tax=Wyeomyia smithii TaxID=174621 RepID=UPI002467B213|nr:uncharacterized protein LOC129731093 [Wyeomyia smithii]XP_055546826.1 uncharacterized protein LOC129731093 [Wyeomyia smithii]XP_055546827.1 uncharacterized protein LOC129731093 [Wyeomyia smithii]